MTDQCEYKGLDSSAQLGTTLKGHSSARDPQGSAKSVTGPASQTDISFCPLASFSSNPSKGIDNKGTF